MQVSVHLLVEFWEALLQALNCLPPLRSRWLAYGVLVAEHTYLLNTAIDFNRLEPFNRYEVFCAVRVVGIFTMVFAIDKAIHIQRRLLAACSHNFELGRSHSGSFNPPDTNKAVTGSLYPYTVADGEQV